MKGRRPTLVGVALLTATAVSAVAANFAQAAFSSAATASQSVSSRSLGAPSALSASASGHNVALSWSAGTNGNGYQLLTAANGTNPACGAASFTSLSTTAALSATDSGRYLPQGSYQCYQVRTTYNTWWSVSGNPIAAVQLGFVAASVTVTSGGVAGDLDAGDSIVVTYNQPVNTTTGPVAADNICTDSISNTIVLGSNGSGTTCNATPASVGTITGMTVAKKGRFAATWSWNGAHTVLTITLGAKSAGFSGAVSGSGTFNPTTTAGGMLSATGAFHNCDTNSGSGNCLPAVSAGF